MSTAVRMIDARVVLRKDGLPAESGDVGLLPAQDFFIPEPVPELLASQRKSYSIKTVRIGRQGRVRKAISGIVRNSNEQRSIKRFRGVRRDLLPYYASWTGSSPDPCWRRS